MRPSGGVLAIIGSGETSPTMVTVHRTLRPDAQPAVVLQTPYTFQENVDTVSERTRGYFAHRVGLDVAVHDGTATDAPVVRTAEWVFAGPGSPSYALDRWRGAVAEALRDRITAAHGVTVFASAAAATLGVVALPVYEIYKAGADPHWLAGLDVLSRIGLTVAVIPHYDNAEGQTHDTRYCYLGQRRLEVLEAMLPGDAAVLGVDEHTAVIIDLRAATVRVTGRGGLTVRRGGISTVLPAGTVTGLRDLRELVEHGRPIAASQPQPQPQPGRTEVPAAESRSLPELITTAQDAFAAAAERGDGPAMANAVLDLDATVQDWATDLDEDQGPEQARAVVRTLIARLGDAVASTSAREQLHATLDAVLALRADWRNEGSYAEADRLRAALLDAGLRVNDTPDGTRWSARPYGSVRAL
jgi:hypothetical protein